MNIICFSNIDWKFIKQRHQHLMLEFANRKEINKIVFVETLGTRSLRLNKEDFKRGVNKLRRIYQQKNKEIKNKNQVGSQKIRVFSPKYIPSFDIFSMKINEKILIKDIKKILLEEHIDSNNTIAWIMLPHPIVMNLVSKFNFKLNIYDCIDDMSSIPDIKSIIIKTEENLIKNCNIVFSTSKLLYDKCINLNKNTFMLKNAVSSYMIKDKNYLSKNILNSNCKKIVGYVGTIYSWFDIKKIYKLAVKREDIKIILAGPSRVDLNLLENRDNIELLGQIPYERVGELIKSFDVCLIPFVKNNLILNTNPVKLYEYFAKGKPVVAIDIPELEEYKDILYIYNSEDEFIRYVDKALTECDVSKNKKRIDVALNNTWSSRVDFVLQLIKNYN